MHLYCFPTKSSTSHEHATGRHEKFRVCNKPSSNQVCYFLDLRSVKCNAICFSMFGMSWTSHPPGACFHCSHRGLCASHAKHLHIFGLRYISQESTLRVVRIHPVLLVSEKHICDIFQHIYGCPIDFHCSPNESLHKNCS